MDRPVQAVRPGRVSRAFPAAAQLSLADGCGDRRGAGGPAQGTSELGPGEAAGRDGAAGGRGEGSRGVGAGRGGWGGGGGGTPSDSFRRYRRRRRSFGGQGWSSRAGATGGRTRGVPNVRREVGTTPVG